MHRSVCDEDRYESSAVNRDLSTMIEDIRVYWFYASIDDHAQTLCDVLKEGDRPYLKQSWLIFLPELEDEERLLTAWKASHGPQLLK